jgi:hypothetical protein
VLDQDQRKKAMKELRRRAESGRAPATTARR